MLNKEITENKETKTISLNLNQIKTEVISLNNVENKSPTTTRHKKPILDKSTHITKKIKKIDDISKPLKNSEETFSSMVIRKIEENGMSDVACYKAANLNRQIFSKIRSSAGEKENDSYQPNKNTALSLAIALKLSIDESYELLKKAGFTFSKSNKTDIIVEFCIKNNINDITMVNEILFYYNQPLLGSKSQI